MSVITKSKNYEEVCNRLLERSDLKVMVVGCDKCAKLSSTGGAAEVQAFRERLRGSGVALLEVAGLVDAVEEGLCDPKAVAQRLKPLADTQEDYQILVLSCGAGLKCVQDTLPSRRIVPGLDTLGPGVKSDLACLACGDCRFGEDGCKMLQLVEEQANRLGYSYRETRPIVGG
jgi:hypothetical protein